MSSSLPLPVTAPVAAPGPRLRGLDEALPAEITGRELGPLTRYRRFAVFSGPWVRGRLRLFGGAVGSMLLLSFLPLLWRHPADWPLGPMVHLGTQMLLPVLVGPLLGLWVRRRGWPAQTEWAALVGAVLAVVVALLAFHQWAAEPTKQWLAERVGAVDDSGQRRRVVMSIGVTISSPDETPRPATPDARAVPEITPAVRAANALSSAVLSFWLAGGAALWGWRRERAALASLAREQELAREQAQRREAELRLSVLAAQVEPHFLFNTLAGVRSAIATDPARASQMIDRLVDYLRAAIPRLRNDGSAQATVGAQFEIVRAYLALMQSRMPRLAFELHAPPDLLGARCPPLMLISLAENAVKHGVELKVGPARVELLAERDEQGRLVLSVLDDGVGFGAAQAQAGSGLGLTNIRERLAQLYGPRATLQLKARPEGGVAARLTLPLEFA
jgi:signal transduction histidine kinase